jgi:hypothetical protein
MLYPVTDDMQICAGASARTHTSLSDRMRSIAGAMKSAPAHLAQSNGPLGAHMQTAIDAAAMLQSGEGLIRGGARAIAARSVDGTEAEKSSSHAERALSAAYEERTSALRESFHEAKRFSMDGYGIAAPFSMRTMPTPCREARTMETARRIAEESTARVLAHLANPDAFKPATNVLWRPM